MDKREIAVKIIDFWHTIDFLSQESFPVRPRKDNTMSKIVERALKDEHLSKSDRYKLKNRDIITSFQDITEYKALEDIIKNDNEKYEKYYPKLSSKIHICMGKFSKEALTDKLYEKYGGVDERQEKDRSKVPIIGLKVDERGYYEEDSLSLSPLIWGVSKLLQSTNLEEQAIKLNDYEYDIADVAKIIDRENPLNYQSLTKLYNKVYDKFIKPMNIQDPEASEDIRKLIYYRYKDDATLDKEDDKVQDFSNLSNCYYVKDLEMIKDSIKSRKYLSKMEENIIDYIVKMYYESQGIADSEDRVNIRDNVEEIEKCLQIENYPLGKWPGKFDPALMQQIAINIGISDADKNRKIFSVNGPPGTGKTTLLKEVIASNIVERAKVMLNYEKADDAFERTYFLKEDGSKKIYDKIYKAYYELNDKELTRYGILVASCNNAAVENITKELPSLDKLLGALESDDIDIKEISNLFDTETTENRETYKEYSKEIEKPDIYFTYLADKLSSQTTKSKDNKDPQWGIISAPMGKSSNIKNYYETVIDTLLDNFFKNQKMIDARHEKFVDAQDAFEEQLEIVDRLKDELDKNSKLSMKLKERKSQLKQRIAASHDRMNYLENSLPIAYEKLKSGKNDLKQYEEEFEKAEDILASKIKLYNEIKSKIQDIDNLINENNQEIEDVKKSCSTLHYSLTRSLSYHLKHVILT